MIEIAIVALPRCHASGIHGVLDFFVTANFCHEALMAGSEPLFDCHIVSLDDEPVRAYSGALVVPTTRRETFAADVIVLGSGLETVGESEDLDHYLEKVSSLNPWLKKAADRGALLASVCTGSFVLAEAGLLTGQVATTHWRAAAMFRQRYPELKLDENQLLVDNGQVVCAGGASAFIDLCLYLVERLSSPAIASACSKLQLLEGGRVDQTPYMIFIGSDAHNDAAIQKAQNWLEQHFADNIAIDDLASVAGLGARTFKRRFKEATGESPLSYLQQLRVEAAKHLLESTQQQTAQISWQVGYEDASSFRRLFKRTVGCTMEQYRKRFSYAVPKELKAQA
ncbi:helix-turn-helix domain-containing protein [Marinobacter salinisoli]|uniref:Helix-turn-helix domain-containing protein n=1 Tax=Marinobacter salinisoli TaxID=2769486 RepID=A0ABX7MPR1_9GAMM|nr:helix-turn-helix domain-containing protein [Marinobacter salinisoli]QSP94317.1 helix-turn-helix domain-containing protein [Marinobacter salinisoli]